MGAAYVHSPDLYQAHVILSDSHIRPSQQWWVPPSSIVLTCIKHTWCHAKLVGLFVQSDERNAAISERTSFFTQWGQVTHVCVSKLTSIGSDNGLSPGRRQAIIWTNAGVLGTNFGEIVVEGDTFSFREMHLKMSSGNCGHFVTASMW